MRPRHRRGRGKPVEKRLPQPVARWVASPSPGEPQAFANGTCPAMMHIIVHHVAPGPLQSNHAWLDNSAGPLDGRRVARPRLLSHPGPGLPGAQRRRRPRRGSRPGPLPGAGRRRPGPQKPARLMVAAWLGLRLRAVLLLPIGGLFAYADPESQEGQYRYPKPCRG